MYEVPRTPDESGQSEMSTAEQEAQVEALKAKIAWEIAECESQITFYTASGFLQPYLDQLYPTIIPRLVELYEQEIEVLSALDPQTTSEAEVKAIRASFHQQREALAHNI